MHDDRSCVFDVVDKRITVVPVNDVIFVVSASQKLIPNLLPCTVYE